jgi:hypothetical protein
MRNAFPWLSVSLIGLGTIAFICVLAWSVQRSRRVPGLGQTIFDFRYKLIVRAIAAFAAFGVPAGFAMLLLWYRPLRHETAYIIAVYLICAGLGLPLFWETGRYLLRVTPNGIERRSGWTPYRVLTWDDVAEVRYSSLNAWFVFVAENGEKIRVHALIDRLNDLLRLAEGRLPPTALIKARTGYERIGRALPKLGSEPVLEARPPRW